MIGTALDAIAGAGILDEQLFQFSRCIHGSGHESLDRETVWIAPQPCMEYFER